MCTKRKFRITYDMQFARKTYAFFFFSFYSYVGTKTFNKYAQHNCICNCFFLHKPSKHAFILFCICRSAFEWNPLSSDSSNVWFVQMYIVHNILQFIFSFQEIRVELSVFWLQVLCIHYFISTTFSSLFFFCPCHIHLHIHILGSIVTSFLTFTVTLSMGGTIL